MKRMVAFLVVSSAMALGWSAAQEAPAPSAPTDDESTIRNVVAAYVEAFNKRDAKALADHWMANAVYVNRSTGERVVGRAAIAEQFTALFKDHPELKLEANVESVQFLSPSVAVEHGTAKFAIAQGLSSEVEYTAVYVKQNDRWLLDRVTDVETVVVPSHHEHLKPLEWMVGRWSAASAEASVDLECNWAKGQNFLTRSFKVVAEDIDMAGVQVIGWDAAAKTIRSWTFDSNGGFADGTWTRKDNAWFIHNKGVTPDGQKASMVNVMKVIDDNSFSWQTVERTSGGELLPNIDEVLIVRH